ncbi:MAG TPA: SDR family oxidoreductase [Candidatus Latescibacteria bacterium]|jgi:NAD(P)-dependent dehydrogenase (short-subunit alcohol dehydrogenase family)|nr:short-chain dehydrogenase [Gemmatimonadaceae bacterium]MDP6016708.1 SDR family oxidoreductase [Candidatus Latescibacterota bacterium]HJP32091.1 SDR family oxidoreductase [Candidatus Latescibacterota bacterium]
MTSASTGRVAGKVAIVTGGASGIGESTALRLAREGASVAVADVDDANGKRVVADIIEAGGEALFVRTDLSKTAQIRRMVERTVKKYGRLDIVHNNAIWFRHAPATELDEKDWDLTLNVGLKAVFLAAKFAIPEMRRTGGGAIVNTGSVHSLAGFATCTAYDSTKAGIMGLTRVLAIDYGPDIRVNAVLPGAILTPLWDNLKVPPKERRRYAALVPAQRLGTGEDVANAVLYLASDEASFVTGTSLTVDGGLLCGGENYSG